MRAVAALVAVAMVAIATPSPKVFAFQGTAAAKSDAPSPAGKWKLSLDTPHGTMVMNFDLKMEKDKLTGTMTNDMMGTVPVSGTYADGKLAMVAQGQATINFNFTFKDRDTLTGNLSSEMGDMACSAARVKEKV